MSYQRFRRQFLIARRAVAPDESWRQHPLPDGWVLSYQGALTITPWTRPDGNTVLLLGNAFRLASGSGSGRHAVVDWPHVHGDDAGATLSIFQGERDGERVIASSPGLAVLALGGDPAVADLPFPLRHHSPQNYVPAPGTRYRGVRRLFRDQKLHVPTGALARRAIPLNPLASHAAAVDVVATELTGFARELAGRTRGRIVLQLTAGLDSRTILACFMAAGVPFDCVTQRSPAKPEEDIIVARAICRRFGIRHDVSDMLTPPDPEASGIYWEQTGGGMNGWDLTHLMPGRIYRFLEEADVMIGGACFELGRGKFGNEFADMTLETATGAEIWRRLARGEPGAPDFTAFLDEWLDWRRAAPYALSLTASHYLDQRIGAWAASGMTGYDLISGLTLHPANNPRIFEALITPAPEDQSEGRLQRDVIRSLVPDLAQFPVNPVPLHRKVRKRVLTPLHRLRALLR